MAMNKYNYIIAIDPDVEKSGVAILKTFVHELTITNMAFPKMIMYLNDFRSLHAKSDFLVVVEAGWMNQSNWHLNPRDSKAVAAAKGNSTGRNHETGRKIVECVKYFDCNVLEHLPLVKGWKGKDGKITAEELAYFTGYTARTNQDARDAALLAWCVAGLPIRVKCG